MLDLSGTIPFAFRHLICLSAVMLGLQTVSVGQLASYHASLHLYEDAVELFEKEKYGPAQRKIESFLVFEDELRANEANDLRANARFIQAVSAYYLLRSETEELLTGFIRNFPENTKVPLASYYLGKYHIERRNYGAAIRPLLVAVQSSGLTQERFDEAVYLLAYSHLANNQPVQAISYFDMLTRRENPYQEDANYYKAVLLYEQGQYEEAYPAFKELEKSRKYGQDTRIYYANTLLKLKKLDELYLMADELVSRPVRRGESQIYYIVANASFEREDYPRTTEYFEEYVENRGRMSRADYFRFGYAAYQQGRFDEAIPIFERAQRSTSTDSLTQVSSYYLGFCFLKTGEENGAKLAFEKAARGGRGSVPEITQDALYQYAKVAFSTEAYDEALKALTRIRQEYPRAPYIPEVNALIGEVYLYTRNYPEAIRYFESTTLSTNRARKAYQSVCYYYGLELIERPDYPNAQKYFKKTVDNPVDQDLALSAIYWSAEAYYRQGKLSPAKSTFQRFLSSRGATSNAFYADGQYGLGWVYFKEKSYGNAVNNFDSFLKNKGAENPPRMKVDANLRAGDALFLQKKYSQAVSYYQNVMSLKYAYRDYATYQIAECYYRLGRYSQAVAQLDILIRKGKNSEFRDDALDRISDIYATWLNDYPKSMQYAKMLTQQYPKSPLAGAAYIRMAFAAIKLGRESEAVTYYKKVLTDYGADKDNARAALDNLSSLVSPSEYDRILRDYQNRYPDLDENFGDLVFSTGKERFFEGSYQSAIDQFSTYIKKYPGATHYYEALLFRARCHRELNSISKALDDYERIYNATVNTPYTFPALQEAAEINYEKGSFSESLSLYEKLENASSKVQNQVTALFGVAKSHVALNDYAAAEVALRKIADNIEATEYARTKARVEIGQAQFARKQYDAALATFSDVEAEFKNAFGAESQYMIAKIYLEQGRLLKRQGRTTQADEKFEEVKNATRYMANNYPTFDLLKAQTFLLVAEAYYELGSVYQAEGTLESLAGQDQFPEVRDQAQARLNEIRAEANN